jgi:CubicO group peptidase (beta-lactamase class C family)
MGGLHGVRAWLPARLADLAAEHQVPGAAMAVLAGGETAEAAYGVLSRATSVEVTTDTVFQIGSITKVWTASLIMQLVDDGVLDLDAPVRRYVPEFRVADEQASSQITVRHLCSHVSGFEGDIFTDTGRGDDAVERYLATITEVPQLFPPGERFSYNNAGYVVLGRILEVLRGKPYNAILREQLFGPLGLTHAAADAYEAILHRAAVGHIRPDPDGAPVPAPTWALVSSNAPAGALLAMSAADLLRFARMHLDGGGEALSAASVKAMQQRQVELPYLGILGDAWGIGWEIFDWDGGTVIGHDGGTVGQAAFLRVVPGAGVAVALLTNGGDPLPVYRELVGRALSELAGVRMPDLPAPPAEPERVDPAPYAGRYEADVVLYEVNEDDQGRLWLELTPRGPLAEAGLPPERYEIVRLRGETFVSAQPRGGMHQPVAFMDFDAAGRATFLHQGRAIPRAAG